MLKNRKLFLYKVDILAKGPVAKEPRSNKGRLAAMSDTSSTIRDPAIDAAKRDLFMACRSLSGHNFIWIAVLWSSKALSNAEGA